MNLGTTSSRTSFFSYSLALASQSPDPDTIPSHLAPEASVYPLPLLQHGFPGGTVVENPPADAGDAGDADSIPGSGRFPGGENGHPLQYACLENPMDRESHGQRSLVGNCPWGRKESDVTEHSEATAPT